MNIIRETDKPIIKKTVVIYAGRFQPFHKGHYAAYKKLVDKFGQDSVYIGTSNDTNDSKSPFNFNEKKKIATTMFGIPTNHFVNIKNPYKPVEILKSFDEKTTQYIAAVGEKDAARLRGKYFKPYEGKAGYGYKEIGYVYPVPAEQNPISGTDVRKGIGGDEEGAKKFFLKAYPKYNKEIFKMITDKIKSLQEDGLPGGVITGLVSPGGYINGAPKPKDVAKTSKKLHKNKETDTNKDYVYDPIMEIINQVITEEAFEEFINEYLGEADAKGNPALDQDISYKNTKGQSKKIKARDALRLPKDHPAHIQAAKIAAKAEPAPEKKSKEEKPGADKKPAEKEKGGEKKPTDKNPAAAEPVKLSGAELKSSAEKSPEQQKKDNKSAEVKASLDNEISKLSPDDKKAVEDTNNPDSPERKEIANKSKSWLSKVGNKLWDGAKNWARDKKEMCKGVGSAIKTLASGGKIGSVKDENGKMVHHTDFKDKHEEVDPKSGKKKTVWKDKEDLSTEQKTLKEKSEHEHHRQKHAVKHMAKDLGLLAVSLVAGAGVGGAIGGAISHGVAGLATGAAHGVTAIASHGAVGVGAHIVKDLAKHSAFEAMGMKGHHAAGATAAVGAIGHLLEGDDENGEKDSKLVDNLLKRTMELISTYKMSDEQLLQSIQNYNKNKGEDTAKDIMNTINESVLLDKAKVIKDFVEYATERLKLKDKPKVKLLLDKQYANQKSSLGGYSPTTKDIYVVVPGRMTADICRTIAHELVHRKQDEMNLIKNEEEAGKTGSPVENQANAVAGILMRDYGKLNKEIYNEGKILNEVSYLDGGDDQPNGAWLPKGARRTLAANNGINKSDDWFTNGGYIQLDYPEADQILGDDDENQIYVKYITKNVPRQTNTNTQFDKSEDKVKDVTKDKVKKTINEMGRNDIHFKNIYNHYRDGDAKMKQTIAKIITGNAFAKIKEIVKDMREMNHDEIEEIENEIGIPIQEDINVDVNPGDEVLMGKFKNKKVKIKDIGKDQHGMPTINGKQATTFRIGTNSNIFEEVFNEFYDRMMNESINEAKLKTPDYIITTIPASAIPSNRMAKADVGLGLKMGGEMSRWALGKKDYKLDYHNDKVALVLSKDGKLSIKVKSEKDPNYLDKIEKFANTYLSDYVKKIKKESINESNEMGGAMQDDQSYRSPYFKKWKDWDKRGNVHADIVGYTVHSHTSDSFKEKKKGVVLPSNNPSEENGEGKRWMHPVKGEEYAKDKKEKWEMYPFNSRHQAYTPPPDIGKQIDIFKYTKPNIIKENIEEWNQLLLEGGAYGHMSHPFDDMELTFGQLKDIISKALDGDLGVVREKTDGQALAISWKNGRLIAARNKGHLQNAGEAAMGIEDVASKFAGRGGLTDAYNYAMKDLSTAIQSLSKGQRDKVFDNGKCFMNIEVIWPTSVNVIPYGQALLVFHNTTCYDETGKAVGADQSAARTLAGMIKQINADVQSKYTIQGPPITEIPKSQNLSSLKTKYLSKLSKLQSEFGLSDSDTVSLYHQSWWENFVDINAPIKVDKMTKEALVKRWAFGDKSFKLNTISNEELVKWAIDTDKINVVKQQKDNIRPFEEIFLGVGADILSFVSSVLTVHPDKAIRNMKDRLKDVAEKVRTAGNPAQIQKFKSELERLNKLGGVNNIVASEGLVFFYGGKTYKLTGTFAPLNQLLGIFYE